MEESSSNGRANGIPSRSLNPWVLHFEKMGIELKCPHCSNFFVEPVLLPCNHLLCKGCIPFAAQIGSGCPLCKAGFAYRDIRPAPFMHKMVSIYRSLDATFSTNMSKLISTEMAGPKMKIPKHLHFRSLMGCQAHLDRTRRLITDKLTENQMRMFRAHPLGRLIDVKFTFSGPLTHFMLLRQIDQPNQREIQFYVGGQVMTFTYSDFMRIVGLLESSAQFVEPKANDRIRKVLLNERYAIKKKDLEELFMNCRVVDYNDDDMVRFALLFFIELVLMGGLRARSMSYSYLHILDDSVATVTFPWGDMLWRRLLSGLQTAISVQKMKKIQENMQTGKKSETNEKGPCLVGFAYAFQAWVYEQIPKLVERHFVSKVKDGAPIPLLSWRSGIECAKQENLEKNIFKDLDKISIAALAELGDPESSEDEDVLAEDVSVEVVPIVNVGTSKKRKRDMPSTSRALKSNIDALHAEMKDMRAEMHEMKEKHAEMQANNATIRADLRRILMIVGGISQRMHVGPVDESGGDDDEGDAEQKVREDRESEGGKKGGESEKEGKGEHEEEEKEGKGEHEEEEKEGKGDG